MNTQFTSIETATAALAATNQSPVEALVARQKEAVAALKHNHIVSGTMVRALDVGGEVADKWGKKFVCIIRTRGVDGEFDGNFRIVATSDLHQVHHTEAVKKALKKADRPQTGKMNKIEAALARQGISLDDLLNETEETAPEVDLEAALVGETVAEEPVAAPKKGKKGK